MSKEANLIILDVGPAMNQDLSVDQDAPNKKAIEIALDAVRLLVQQKLILGKKQDVMGMVVFGSNGTHNVLADGDGYEHVSVTRELMVADVDFLKSLYDTPIQLGSTQADLIDALVVGMDLLHRFVGTKKYEKKIYLITSGGCLCANPEDLDTILEHCDLKLNVIGIGMQADEDDDEGEEAAVVDASALSTPEAVLKYVCKKVDGQFFSANEALDLLKLFMARTVRQTAGFRGQLELAPGVQIAVHAFLKTKSATLPTFKKMSLTAAEADGAVTTNVKREITYHPVDDNTATLEKDDLVRAYRYGRTEHSMIPVDKGQEEQGYKSGEACMKIIAFTKQESIPREHFMANVECVSSPPGDSTAQKALATLAHAMHVKGVAAVCRYVKRADSAPKIAALFPHVSSEYECFYLVTLPFSEDLREYTFPSLDTRVTRELRTARLAAAEELITALDLMEADRDMDGDPLEAYKPKFTYNPTIQYFNQCLATRAVNPQTPLPSATEMIQRITEPKPAVLQAAQGAIKQFAAKCPTHLCEKSEAKRQKSKRRYWKEILEQNLADALTAEAGSSSGVDAKRARVGDDETSVEQRERDAALAKVGDDDTARPGGAGGPPTRPRWDPRDPIGCFKEWIGRRDVDWVDDAIEEMGKDIHTNIKKARRGPSFERPAECLRVLRAGCIDTREAKRFNTYLTALRSFCEDEGRTEFWEKFVAQPKLTLIDNDDTTDPDACSPAEAKAFHEPDAAVVVPKPEPPPEPVADEEEDLFGALE